jgi:hypothetical protein
VKVSSAYKFNLLYLDRYPVDNMVVGATSFVFVPRGLPGSDLICPVFLEMALTGGINSLQNQIK